MMRELLKFKILDRYILKKYVVTFLFTMTLLSLIAVVFEVSERIENFISKHVPLELILKEYLLNFVPWINSLIFPIYALITVIFFTSRMASQTEIIPMLSAGISYTRILKPFIIGGILFTAIHLIGNHFVVPRGNKVLKEFENKYIKPGNIRSKDRHVHLFIAPETKAFIRYFNSSDTSGIDFQLEKFTNNKIVALLKAKSVKWKAEPHVWTIKDYEIRTFGEQEETLEVYKDQAIDSSLNMVPGDFVFIANQKDMLPSVELLRFIRRERSKGSGITRLFEVELHRRTADPFTTLILTFIGACIASRKTRGGTGLHLAVAVVLGVVYIFLSKLSLTFANNELMPPLLAVWIPNLIFIGVAWIFYTRSQK